MVFTKDQADALLFALTNNKQFVVKGRNVGKTAAMNPPFRLHKAQQVTFDQLSAAYDKAMKQNSNPYQVPPHKTTTAAVCRADLNAVISSQLLPSCVDDVAGTYAFDSWTWHGFSQGITGKLVGLISARHVTTNTHCEHKFYLTSIELDSAVDIINILDRHLMQGIFDIVDSLVAAHDINTCKDPECMC